MKSEPPDWLKETGTEAQASNRSRSGSQRDIDSSRSRKPRAPLDRHLLVRRGVAVGAIIVLVVLVAIGVRGCLTAQTNDSIKKYVESINALTKESNLIDTRFFQLLDRPRTDSALDLQNTINALRSSSDQVVQRLEGISVPDDLKKAHEWYKDVLKFRSESLAMIARELPSAFAQRDTAVAFRHLAGEMQLFFAGDVLYARRFLPETASVLRRHGLNSQVSPTQSRALPDLAWLDPSTIQSKLGVQSATADASGTHGVALVGVTAQPQGTTLSTESPSVLEPSPSLAFDVEVENQGDSDEQNVVLSLNLNSTPATTITQTIPVIKAGESVAVSVPLDRTLPAGPIDLDVDIRAVTNEKTLTNNKAQYELSVEP